jgi:hypothetical protein
MFGDVQIIALTVRGCGCVLNTLFDFYSVFCPSFIAKSDTNFPVNVL